MVGYAANTASRVSDSEISPQAVDYLKIRQVLRDQLGRIREEYDTALERFTGLRDELEKAAASGAKVLEQGELSFNGLISEPGLFGKIKQVFRRKNSGSDNLVLMVTSTRENYITAETVLGSRIEQAQSELKAGHSNLAALIDSLGEVLKDKERYATEFAQKKIALDAAEQELNRYKALYPGKEQDIGYQRKVNDLEGSYRIVLMDYNESKALLQSCVITHLQGEGLKKAYSLLVDQGLQTLVGEGLKAKTAMGQISSQFDTTVGAFVTSIELNSALKSAVEAHLMARRNLSAVTLVLAGMTHESVHATAAFYLGLIDDEAAKASQNLLGEAIKLENKIFEQGGLQLLPDHIVNVRKRTPAASLAAVNPAEAK